MVFGDNYHDTRCMQPSCQEAFVTFSSRRDREKPHPSALNPSPEPIGTYLAGANLSLSQTCPTKEETSSRAVPRFAGPRAARHPSQAINPQFVFQIESAVTPNLRFQRQKDDGPREVPSGNRWWARAFNSRTPEQGEGTLAAKYCLSPCNSLFQPRGSIRWQGRKVNDRVGR